MALIVGVDRGFITREQGIQRLTQILDFLEKVPRYHGAWPHLPERIHRSEHVDFWHV